MGTHSNAIPFKGHRSFLEVLSVFLRLGVTSFGGPIAHLGYFRAEIVERRKWLDEAAYTDTIALCQFLPGPASSHVGIILGMVRAGLPGGFAAWLGFTIPSALALQWRWHRRAVDRLVDLGGAVAELSPKTQARLDAVLPPTWSKGNPSTSSATRTGNAMLRPSTPFSPTRRTTPFW